MLLIYILSFAICSIHDVNEIYLLNLLLDVVDIDEYMMTLDCNDISNDAFHFAEC